jgi:diguanylate cyclase (GGDEF)-like protein
MVDPLLYGDSALEKVFPHLTRILGRHLDHAITYTEAKSLSYVDDLTDLYNQRYLKLVLEKEISRSHRGQDTFSVLFMDIDHFKQVNDTRGHLIGSQVLVEMSKILRQNIRTMDYGFRYGGDEFLLILVGTGSKDAITVAERIRRQVEKSIFKIDKVEVKVTLSIGIATYPEHATTKEEIIALADRAMYCGKNQSRNVVYVAS